MQSCAICRLNHLEYIYYDFDLVETVTFIFLLIYLLRPFSYLPLDMHLDVLVCTTITFLVGNHASKAHVRRRRIIAENNREGREDKLDATHAMLEKLVIPVLNKVLGKYVEDLNADQFNTDIWKGTRWFLPLDIL